MVRAILLEGRESYSRAAWLLLLIALPGLATLLYLLFGEPWVSARFRKTSRDAYEALLAEVDQEEGKGLGSPESANAFRTCAAAAHWPASAGNRATVAPEGDAAIDMVVRDIDAATRTVHLSFYIWLGDGNGTKVVEAVCHAARRGVTCRIVADAIGSRRDGALRPVATDARGRRDVVRVAGSAFRDRLPRWSQDGPAQPPQDRGDRWRRDLVRQPELRRSRLPAQEEVRALGRHPDPLRGAGRAAGGAHLRLGLDG